MVCVNLTGLQCLDFLFACPSHMGYGIDRKDIGVFDLLSFCYL